MAVFCATCALVPLRPHRTSAMSSFRPRNNAYARHMALAPSHSSCAVAPRRCAATRRQHGKTAGICVKPVHQPLNTSMPHECVDTHTPLPTCRTNLTLANWITSIRWATQCSQDIGDQASRVVSTCPQSKTHFRTRVTGSDIVPSAMRSADRHGQL